MVGLKVDFYWLEIGAPDFFNSFFSSVAYHLESRKWGSRFPVVLNDLYEGLLQCSKIVLAQKELKIIKEEFKRIPPSNIIWDIDDFEKKPPWGSEISSDITDLSNYWVTCNGVDLFEVLNEALNYGLELNAPVEVKNL